MKIFGKLAQFSSVVKPTVGRLIAELSFSAPPSKFIIIHDKMYLIKFLLDLLHCVLLQLFFCRDCVRLKDG